MKAATVTFNQIAELKQHANADFGVRSDWYAEPTLTGATA